MGARDADSGRGLDRAEASKMSLRESLVDISNTLAAAGELARIKEAPDYAEAFSAAADTLRALAIRRQAPRITDPSLRATGWHAEMNEEAKEMRLSFYHGAEANILSWITLPTPEIYALSERCLKIYDKLEGVK